MKTLLVSRRLGRLLFQILIGLAWLSMEAFAYMVPPPLSLEKLAEGADVIFKAQVVSSAEVNEPLLPAVRGFVSRETEFQIISVIKGEIPGANVKFRHYDQKPFDGGIMFQPQSYHFEREITYLVFAKKTDVPGRYLQARNNHTMVADQGVLRCANDQPVAEGGIKKIVWAELLAHLQSAEALEVVYGLEQLDPMSTDAGSDGTGDFAREDAFKVVAPLLRHADESVVSTAVIFAGIKSPYNSLERARFWLSSVGGRATPGLVQMKRQKNLGGELFLKELVSIANGEASAETRAHAICALGLVGHQDLREPMQRWTSDPEREVRGAAALLLADFPDERAFQSLRTLAADAEPGVRLRAAYAIGFVQQIKLVDVLSALLKDPEERVRRAASEALLSFSPKIPEIAALYRENVANEEFSPLFLNVLAAEKPADYLEQLAEIVEKDKTPQNWSGGEMQSFTAWKTLFGYIGSQPLAEVKAGKCDRQLAALESYFRVSSSEPVKVYAFYLQSGLTERAKQFRAKAKTTAQYDIDYFFNQVDEAPSRFLP